MIQLTSLLRLKSLVIFAMSLSFFCGDAVAQPAPAPVLGGEYGIERPDPKPEDPEITVEVAPNDEGSLTGKVFLWKGGKKTELPGEEMTITQWHTGIYFFENAQGGYGAVIWNEELGKYNSVAYNPAAERLSHRIWTDID